MDAPGILTSAVLGDGRVVEYWDGGDPAGRPVIFQPGTPTSRLEGIHGHAAATETQVRLVSVSRPGYGGSTKSPPSLAGSGRDAVELADLLGLDRFAVLGSSGGGPFAVATALAAPDRVSGLGVLAGIGPWSELDEPVEGDAEERQLLEAAAAGDVAGALDGYLRTGRRVFDRMLALPDGAMVETFFADVPLGGGVDRTDPRLRTWWAADLREALTTYDGYARDNVAFGAAWDIDPREVRVPTYLWYGAEDLMVPASHGRWLADQISDARLVVLPGEGHASVIFGHWADAFAALLV